MTWTLYVHVSAISAAATVLRGGGTTLCFGSDTWSSFRLELNNVSKRRHNGLKNQKGVGGKLIDACLFCVHYERNVMFFFRLKNYLMTRRMTPKLLFCQIMCEPYVAWERRPPSWVYVIIFIMEKVFLPCSRLSKKVHNNSAPIQGRKRLL